MGYNCQTESRAEIRTSEQGPLKPSMVDGKPFIYWHLDEAHLTPDMSKYQILFMLQQCFITIQALIPWIEFRANNKAEESPIIFRWAINGDDHLPLPFDEDVLAYAFFPRGTSLTGNLSDIYMNDSLEWNDGFRRGFVHGRKTIIHEILHALGLHHSENRRDVMYWQILETGIQFPDSASGLVELYAAYRPRIVVTEPEPERDEEEERTCRTIFARLYRRNKMGLRRKNRKELEYMAKAMGIEVKSTDRTYHIVNTLYRQLGGKG